jgi:NtrC-family two-component system response regulator AlgB
MTAPALDVLVVDDEKNIRMTLVTCLEALGCTTREAATAQAARQAAAAHRFDLCFLDLKLGTDDGLALLPELLAAHPGLEVVLVTAYATIDTAVQAIQKGARDYLAKPFSPAQIRHIVEQLRARRALEREVDGLRAQLDSTAAEPLPLVESSAPAMRDVLAILDRVAGFDVPLLLLGENGTGKSALARRVHARSPRARRPFVAVACPTLSEELLSSELFGHVKGAFTGAVADRTGRVEAAAGGTLFLDEIGELPPSLQAKLLQFVQERTFERVGDSRSRTADVRLIAATNRDLDAEVRAGRFREDLLYRLNTVEVRVPPLRDRREDILPLARAFLARFERVARARASGPRGLSLSPEAEAALVAHGWPGNVRELKNAMERAAILAPGVVIGPELLPGRIAEHAATATPFVGGDFTLDTIERAHIEAVLARAATQEDAARILGIDASTLWRKKKRYEGG